MPEKRSCTVNVLVVVNADVWTHKSVQYYLGKYSCEKTADMLRQIIEASSHPGDLVVDFFMGSGSTIKTALSLGGRVIGVELQTERLSRHSVKFR
ncbi:site-specific DNA-methyltransferase [Citrobacter freundii]|uniref:site-specific DNA-methyltransferase n=1 Tax=Citrobacter freundii TaxID=546 RepID=UPI00300C47C7